MTDAQKREPTKAFVREATGLVRNLNWFDGMVMNLAYFNIAAASLLIFGVFVFLFPGSNAVITLGLIGFLVDIPILIVYSMYSAAMPRSGGDYVFVSRSLSPPVGFAVGLVFFVYLSVFSVGQNAWFTTALSIAPELAAIGSTNGNPALVSLSQYIVQPAPVIIIGLVMIAVVFVLALISPSRLHRFLLVCFVIAFAGWPIGYLVVLASSSHAQFVSAFNSYTAAAGLNTTYTGIVSSAQAAGATIISPSLAASIAALPLTYVILVFPQSSTYIGGETKRATRSVPLSMLLGLGLICASIAVMGYYTYNVFGYDFISATGYYFNSGAAGYPLPAAPLTDYFIAILYPNPAFNWFMLISGVAWELLLMLTFTVMATRFLFAGAFDRALPLRLADVSERFHTPTTATIVVILGSIFFLVSATFNFVGTFISGVIGWTSGYLIILISAIAFPFVNKNTFEQSPSFVKMKLGGFPVMSLFGIIGTIIVGYIFYDMFVYPSISGASTAAIGLVVAIYIIGIGIYYVARAYRLRTGVDISLAYKQLPPE